MKSDRLVFSIMFTIDRNGTVLHHWIGHSVVRSCCKMNYALADAIINDEAEINPEGKGWIVAGNPTITPPETNVQEPHTPAEVMQALKNLKNVSDILRAMRITDPNSFAIPRNNVKVKLDEDKEPILTRESECDESHNIVEEFMILSNKYVVHRLMNFSPESVVFMTPSTPDPEKLAKMNEIIKPLGYGELDLSSPEKIKPSLLDIVSHVDSKNPLYQFLWMLFARCMKGSEFCLNLGETTETQYTVQFTSPIRRYADLMIHRLLDDSLKADIEEVVDPSMVKRPEIIEDEFKAFVTKLNEKKKIASSCQRFDNYYNLCRYIAKFEPMQTLGYVRTADESGVEIYIPEFDLCKWLDTRTGISKVITIPEGGVCIFTEDGEQKDIHTCDILLVSISIDLTVIPPRVIILLV